jgi:hypothetical protein
MLYWNLIIYITKKPFLRENVKCNAEVHGTTSVIPNKIFKMSESDLLSELGWKIKNGWCEDITKYCCV